MYSRLPGGRYLAIWSGLGREDTFKDKNDTLLTMLKYTNQELYVH